MKKNGWQLTGKKVPRLRTVDPGGVEYRRRCWHGSAQGFQIGSYEFIGTGGSSSLGGSVTVNLTVSEHASI